jgi:hypothetical protein
LLELLVYQNSTSGELRPDDVEFIGEKMASSIAGYFPDRASADAAYEALLAGGFSQDSVSLIAPGRENGGLADEDEVVSAGDGVKLGGIAGLLLGTAAMLIPGIGPILAVGPLAAGLAGAVTGGVSGAVFGGVAAGLVHAGMSEEEATYFDERLHHGGYLLTVQAGETASHNARQILEQHGADLYSRDTTASDAARDQGLVGPPIREPARADQPRRIVAP